MSGPGDLNRRSLRLHRRENLIYIYDGSFEGLLCCVFEAFSTHTLPLSIWPAGAEQPTLFPLREIPTDSDRADRVFAGIRRLGVETEQSLLQAFLSGLPDKELVLLRFLDLAFAAGPGAIRMLGCPETADLLALVKNVYREAEKYTGFLRFEERENWLGAVFEPENYLLPLLKPHFCGRFPEERFFIYDATHCAVLLYQPHRAEILTLSEPLQMPVATARERYYQDLWRELYRISEIPDRHNLACRRNHCPKRYWTHMTELQNHS